MSDNTKPVFSSILDNSTQEDAHRAKVSSSIGITDRLQNYTNLSQKLRTDLDVSPGTLKDVTMDNSYGVGYRSPCVGSQGFMSGQGNSLREIEEQIVSLRKENFNLRLRVYFLEENVPGYNQPDKTIPEDTLLKKLVDYKVEVEMLRKDVQDKQELLKEAAAALTHMEEIANEKQMQNSADNKLQDCSQISEEIATSENTGKLNSMAANSKISELEELLKASNEKINDFQNQISALDDILTRRDETIKEYQEQIKELRCQKSDLEQLLEAREREMNTVEMTTISLHTSNGKYVSENNSLALSLKATHDLYLEQVRYVNLIEPQLRDQMFLLIKFQNELTSKNQTVLFLREYINKFTEKKSNECQKCKKNSELMKEISKTRNKNNIYSNEDNKPIEAFLAPYRLNNENCINKFVPNDVLIQISTNELRNILLLENKPSKMSQEKFLKNLFKSIYCNSTLHTRIPKNLLKCVQNEVKEDASK